MAFAKLHKVNIVIHQLNSPLWQIEGSENENARELHLSYHNGEHYSSVRCFGDKEGTPADVRLVSLMASCRIVTFHKSFDVDLFADTLACQSLKHPFPFFLLYA